MTIRQHILLLPALFCAGVILNAQETPGDITVDNLRMGKNGKYMVVEMDLGLRGVKVDANRATVFTPVIEGADKSLELNSVGIYSRSRYYYYQRNSELYAGGKDETVIRSSDIPESVPYKAIVPYEDWMADSQLLLTRRSYTCCEASDEGPALLLDKYIYVPEVFRPAFRYVTPEAEAEKIRYLSGRAFIDFPVSQTVIKTDYRNNRIELDKIDATIDSVRNDPDITIKALSIKGFASPESPYSNNERLARGRTAALKEYVSRLHHFDEGFISTSYEPEDWGGLREYVDRSALAHREEILAIIDGNLEPDAKEWKIKSTYPDDYKFLLEYCYPALRHSDYRIEYQIRSFSDPAKIRELVRTQPQKLSPNEFYLAAQSVEQGSDEYSEIFETAVRMYPDDATANLNAANTAMLKGDTERAGRLLGKAGDSAEAVYARGLLAAITEDYDTAALHFRTASEAGITEADEAMEQIEKLKGQNN